MKNFSAGASVLELLARDASGGALLPAAERILEIQRELRNCLPAGIADDCEVCGLDQGSLVLLVSSASTASKLRQTLPRLAEALARGGWKINAIRVRVQPRNTSFESESYRHDRKNTAQMPASAVENFSLLARSLPPSPLRDALENAVRRRRGTA